MIRVFSKLELNDSRVLTEAEIRALISDPKPLVRDFVELRKQLQPAGFELTLRSVQTFRSAGSVDFSNEKRSQGNLENLEFEDDTLQLPAGAYVVRYNEVVALPKDIMALIFPRSTLLRNGATLYTAVWDPGYEGRGQGLLSVQNPHGLRLYANARIGQMIFFKLSKRVRKGYKGTYQHEGL